jgi:hypothetical protein
MIAWLRDTLGTYRRVFSLGGRLLLGNLVLVIPALACLVAPVAVVVVLTPFVAVFGSLGGVVAGVLGVLLESACWSALLACTGEVIRTRRLVLGDVRAGFVAYLGDVVNVRFVLWLITFVAAALPGPLDVMIGLATFAFFNAVPELIYLGRYGTADLLAASYRFIGERWIEWFPMNAILLGLTVLLGVVGALVLAPVAGMTGRVPGGITVGLVVGVSAVMLAFAMLVRGLLFLELTESSRRARDFRRAAGE